MTSLYLDVVDVLSRLRWFNLMILTITPILGAYGIRTTPLCLETALLSIVFYLFSMIGAFLFLVLLLAMCLYLRDLRVLPRKG